MPLFGLLGKKLGHSYSPEIHSFLGEYQYDLWEKEEDEVGGFLQNGKWDGMNVTIPYKKTVIPFLDELSPLAAKTGSVNTIVRRGGRLCGYNTDVRGFSSMLEHAGINARGKKVLLLGSGGASGAVRAALEEMKAEYVIISRSGKDNYDNLFLHADAEIIVNATPVGMYPNVSPSPVRLEDFPRCEGVADLIYNPCRTALLLQAERLNIPNVNGLYMLIAQAKKSAELFLDSRIDESVVSDIYDKLRFSMENIILIGMPGAGKSVCAEKISALTGRKMYDSDEEILSRTGKTPAEIITGQGEERFREIETETLEDLGKLSGAVIATGGGAVTREENYISLHRNGTIVYLKRDISSLATEGRPLTAKNGAEELYKKRKPLYERFADAAVTVDPDPLVTAQKVISAVREAKKGSD